MGKETVCHVHTTNIRIRLHSLLNENSYFKCVYAHKSDTADTQAEPSLPRIS